MVPPPKVTISFQKIKSMAERQAQETPTGRPDKTRKPQFRWNTTRDMSLLTEVEAVKPFVESGAKAVELWAKVASVINALYNSHVDHIGVKNRFNLLLDNFRKEDFQNRYR